MTKAEKLRHCRGCTDDFYNGRLNVDGGTECWDLKRAKLCTRYRIGYWTRPTEPGAFTKVRVFQCRREKGAVFYKDLPSFAVGVREESRL